MDAISRQISTFANQVNEWAGRLVSWLTLLMVLTTFIVVVLRYAFDSGSIALQESITYMYSLLFLLGIGYTLKHDGHVRVDIFYRKFSEQGRAWVNLLGTLLLLMPVTGYIAWVSWDYIYSAWEIKETSVDAGGLPYVYLLKSSILLMTLLLFLQGLSLATLSLRRLLPMPLLLRLILFAALAYALYFMASWLSKEWQVLDFSDSYEAAWGWFMALLIGLMALANLLWLLMLLGNRANVQEEHE